MGFFCRLIPGLLLLFGAQVYAAETGKSVVLQLPWKHQFQFAGYYAALAKGYYHDAGLEVEIREGGDGRFVTEEVRKGQAQYGVGGAEILLDRAEGNDVVVLAAIFQYSSSVLLTRGEDKLTSPQHLIDKRVMLLSGNKNAAILTVFQSENIPLTSIQRVDHSYNLSDLIEGRVDAISGYLTSEPWSLEKNGVTPGIISPTTYGVDFYGDCLFTSKRELEKYSERVKRFREASLKGWEYAMQHSDEIIDLILSQYSVAKERGHLLYEAEAMRRLIFPDLVEMGHMSPGRWQYIGDTFVKLGALSPNYSLEGFLYEPHPKKSSQWIWQLIFVALATVVAGFVLLLLFLNRRLHKLVKVKTDDLVESGRRFQTFFNQSFQIAMLIDTEGRILEVNDMCHSLFGPQGEETIGEALWRAPWWTKDPEVQKNIQGAIRQSAEGKIVHKEVAFTDRDDKHHEVIFVFSPIEAELDEVKLISVIGLDITVRKQAEKEIALLAKFPDENPNPVLRIDNDGVVSYANNNSMTLLGEWGCHKGDRLPEKYCRVVEECLEDGSVHNLEVAVDGSSFALTFSPVLSDSYVNVYGLDISARKKAEEEKEQLEKKLRQAYKMEAIGTMAGGIAHDFNNILAIVMGNAELALMDIPHNNPARDNMDKILLISKRMKNLVGQILSFSRQEEQVLLPVKPQIIVRETLALLRSTTPAMVSIVERIDETCRNIMAEPSQLHQLILNLFSNAVHAIDEDGEIIIGLQEENLVGEDIEYNAKIRPGLFVKLFIVDNGIGMKRKTLDRVCDPFFTTKEVGKGTGMGLAVVHGIVESHDAFLKIVSEPGKGSTFSVYFPVSEERMVEEDKKAVALPRGTERILFVDDEEDITTLGKLVLEGRGYKVRVENKSVEALQAFRSDPGSFDLVITDQAMPNMSGLELVQKLREIRADIPIVMCSGYSEKIDEGNAKEIGLSEFLMKPLEVNRLINIVRKVLDEK